MATKRPHSKMWRHQCGCWVTLAVHLVPSANLPTITLYPNPHILFVDIKPPLHPNFHYSWICPSTLYLYILCEGEGKGGERLTAWTQFLNCFILQRGRFGVCLTSNIPYMSLSSHEPCFFTHESKPPYPNSAMCGASINLKPEQQQQQRCIAYVIVTRVKILTHATTPSTLNTHPHPPKLAFNTKKKSPKNPKVSKKLSHK